MAANRTEAQKLASRLNGAKSRGPKTPEGKAAASRNAMKHGLYSSTVVLTCEKQEEFQAAFEAYTEEWQPESLTELDLVTSLAQASWRLKRVIAIGSASLDLQLDSDLAAFDQNYPGSDETTRLALSYEAQLPTISDLHRHEAHLQRIVDRSISKLLALGEARYK